MDSKTEAYLKDILVAVAESAFYGTGKLGPLLVEKGCTIWPAWATANPDTHSVEVNVEPFWHYVQTIGFTRRWVTPKRLAEIRRIDQSKDFAPGNLEVSHREATLRDIQATSALNSFPTAKAIRGRSQKRLGDHWDGVPYGATTRFVALGVTPDAVVRSLKNGIPWHEIEKNPLICLSRFRKAAAEGLPADWYDQMFRRWGLRLAAARKLRHQCQMLDLASDDELLRNGPPEALMKGLRPKKPPVRSYPTGIPEGFVEAARRAGTLPATALNRLHRGWTPEEAIHGRKVSEE